ncbi:MAG TPA: hypothetical protein VGR73_07845 [Bryobacteraceae bacterium]|nr:hypothetical protein [Bryobacteraceae bacterium]
MKRFTFSLERVLGWRRIEARLEELRAEQLHAELRAIEASREDLRIERETTAAEVRAAGSATGAELAALDNFRRHVDRERSRLERQRVECEKRSAAQNSVLTAKRRDVKILEHLRERRKAAWTAALDRETEQQAAETFLSRWGLRTRGPLNQRQVK